MSLPCLSIRHRAMMRTPDDASPQRRRSTDRTSGAPRRWRRAWLAILTAGLGACGTVPVPPPPAEAPLFQRIEARVGVSFASAARTTVVDHPLVRFEAGRESVARFRPVFASMFATTVDLADWPPWRSAPVPDVDGIVELVRTDAALVVGTDDWRRDQPDIATIGYEICLHEPDGERVRCWTPSASRRHRRGVGECIPVLQKCFVPQLEITMREAIARFMADAEADPVLKAWAGRMAARRGAPR